MNRQLNSAFAHRPRYLVPYLDRLLIAASRYRASLLLFLVCCTVAAIGAVAIRNMENTSAETMKMYAVSVRGLQNIGEMQYEAQEARQGG